MPIFNNPLECDWTRLKPGALCVLVLKGEQDIVFKSVTVDLETRTFHMESLNKAYDPYHVPAREVLEIWKYYSYQSRQVREIQSDIQHISKSITSILSRLEMIEGKIEF